MDRPLPIIRTLADVLCLVDHRAQVDNTLLVGEASQVRLVGFSRPPLLDSADQSPPGFPAVVPICLSESQLMCRRLSTGVKLTLPAPALSADLIQAPFNPQYKFLKSVHSASLLSTER
jgi:hypothetical protein